MGPITGIRIVNLRVRDKVAYPDVTLDLVGRQADHIVVGLENGGGKSTLLGAVYHVFVPEADEFLPRRAQRRQGKQGEPKKLEDYVPGGDPTHFIVEIDAPTPDGTLPLGGGPRLLIGACLWKPAGAPPTAQADEFFWSARGVTPRLALKAFELRGSSGRLLDHAEFRARMKQLRSELPAAQVAIEEGKGAWQRHLRDLGIDVEYVRQFLLRMNEDEGAADRVFTYASSRAFLNSLVGVVGDPASIAQLKNRLVETSEDAAAVAIDRRRVSLLEAMVAQLGPLARTIGELTARLGERDTTVTRLLATRARVDEHLKNARRAAEECSARKGRLERALIEARSAYSDIHARYVQARLQVAQLEARAARAAVDHAGAERERARTRERTALAASLLADRRTADARIRELDELLATRALEAEPIRLALASAIRAFNERLTADRDEAERQAATLTTAIELASKEYQQANDERSRAEAALAALAVERASLGREDGDIVRQLTAAIAAGALESMDQDASHAARDARTRASAASARAEELEAQRLRADGVLARLHARSNELAEATGRAELSVRQAQRELDRALVATRALEDAVVTSGFVESSSVSLDADSEALIARLGEVSDAARRKQGSAAVASAAARRAATWLADRQRLPPRGDVERLCDAAQAKRLGAHPGWSYLATLPPEVATSFAAAHPGLADGVIVNVPEDLDAVVELVASARDSLDGPIVVGPAAAFESTHPRDARMTVVLPHDAYWSRIAALDITDARSAEAVRWDEEYVTASAHGDAATSLRERIVAWIREVGPGGLDARTATLAGEQAGATQIAQERASVADTIADETEARHDVETRRDEAKSEAARSIAQAERLDTLHVHQMRRREIDTRRTAAAQEEVAAAATRDAALAHASDAEARRSAGEARRVALGVAIGALQEQRRELASLAAVVLRPDDPIAAADAAADRQLLAEHIRDRDARWRGAVSDPQLRSQLDTLRSEVRELERKLRDYEDVAAPARSLLKAAPSRAADDYRRDTDAARRDVESLGERIGELKAKADQLDAVVGTIKEELRTVRRPAELTAEERTDDLATARAIRDDLLRRRDDAMNVRTAREGDLATAEADEERAAGRVELLTPVPPRLLAGLRALVRGTPLIPALDVLEQSTPFDVTAILADPELPECLATIVRTYEAALVLDSDGHGMARALADLDAEVNRLEKRLIDLEAAATARLDTTEALLRDSSDDVVKNDRMIQMFRAAPRRALTELAVQHHGDVVQRLEATRHHVGTFDARLQALGETIYATVADLLREVRQTVRDSQLPNTPAMGRWAGSELLKLGGLDTLKVDEKKAAITATLRGWFDPAQLENRSRRFDGDEVVHELLRAVSPQFTARILIPSDPLDPEHMPVDHLARETSGGEGVAVALIMASLLASRRASMRGHRRTTLMLDNPFAKVTKPEFLRLARDVATELRVQLVLFTGIRDVAALAVFPQLTQLRVSRRQNANFVVPYEISDERLQPLLRDGTLYVSPMERSAAQHGDAPGTWPLMSAVTVINRGALDDPT